MFQVKSDLSNDQVYSPALVLANRLADSYILQVIKDSMQHFQAEIEFPVLVDLLVKRRHSVGMVWGQRLCRSLYCVRMLPSSENTCSGSHEASEIGYPCHLTKY